MSDSIDIVTTQMAALEENITGVTKGYAFDQTPNSLQTAVLPCFTNIPLNAEYVDVSAQFGKDVSAEVRDYTAWLWYAPVQRPADISRQASGIQTLVQAVKAYFLARPQFGGLRYVISAPMIADTGPMTADYMGNGTEYTCVGFTFRVTYLEKITFGSGD